MKKKETIRSCRTSFWGVPISVLTKSDLEAAFSQVLNQEEESGQIYFLSFKQFCKALFSPKYKKLLTDGLMILPTSFRLKYLLRAARSVSLEVHNEFYFSLTLMHYLEEKEKSIFLLGGVGNLKIVENHVKASFPNLKIRGKFPGSLKHGLEESLLETVRKVDPTLLILSQKVRRPLSWYADHKNTVPLRHRLVFYSKNLFPIFAGSRKKRPTKPGQLFWLCLAYEICRPYRIPFDLIAVFFWAIVLPWVRLAYSTKKR